MNPDANTTGTTADPVDVEKLAAHSDEPQSSTSKRVLEAAGLLLVWSMFALVEGTLRMTINSNPNPEVSLTDDLDGTIVPAAAKLAGGVAEVIFGLAGFFVAFFVLVFNKGSPTITTAFVIIQVPLGWFVFITFVLAEPIRAAVEATGNDLLSQGEQRALILLGNMLGSINFCWALQGGQFLMGLRLLAAQKGEEESKSKNALRTYVWCGNMLVAAFSTIFVGSLLASKGFTSDTAPVGAPPHVVWYPAISIVTAVVMFLFGGMGIVAAKSSMVAAHMTLMWVFTSVMMLINFSFTFGIVPGLAPPIPGSAQHIGLVFSTTILPMYFAYRTHFSV